MENELLILGTIIKTQGIKGELKLKLFTHFGKKRFKAGVTFYLKKEGCDDKILTSSTYREANGFGFVTFEEIQSCNDAENYIGYSIYKEKDLSLLKKDEYYYCDLEGLTVVDSATSLEVGTIVEVVEYPAQITFRCINDDKKEFFVPFVKAFVNEVDIENKKIFINVIPGLLWK